jgi:3-methyladenine DNA glycosylase Tag
LRTALVELTRTLPGPFVGPTSVYAFMQNVGIVNDHVPGCSRAIDYRTTDPAT